MYRISKEHFLQGLSQLNESYRLFIPDSDDQKFQFKQVPKKSWKNEFWHFPSIRSPQPMKSIFYPPIEKVAEYPESSDLTERLQPTVIIGPKACDIHALSIIDQVYAKGEYPDPFYTKARDEYFIISTDCLEAGEFCYCTLMNCQPYPKADFDLNLSKVNDVFLVEIGSDKGKELFENYFSGYTEAPDSVILEREKFREQLTENVQKQNEKFQYHQSHQDAIEKHLNTEVWEDLGKTCVECGICTQICPTCHCFLMYDQKNEKQFERVKVWDSCFYAGYSRMAGGLTPRWKLSERFKNRFYHKFDSFVTNFDVEACTGCGRCVEGCMGNIDLREVLFELEKRVVLKAPTDIS